MIVREGNPEFAEDWIRDVTEARRQNTNMSFKKAYEMIKLRHDFAFYAVMYWPGLGESQAAQNDISEDFAYRWESSIKWPKKVALVNSNQVGTLLLMAERNGKVLYFQNEVLPDKSEQQENEEEIYTGLSDLVYWYNKVLPEVLRDILGNRLKS